MQKILDVVICETPEFLAYREGLGHGYIHAEMMSKAELDQAEADFKKAIELATKATDNGIEACRQRDEALGQLEGAAAYSEALEEKLESVMYDRDCLGEELEASQARTLEAVDLGLKVVEEFHALDNEYERLEKENDSLRELNSKLGLWNDNQFQMIRDLQVKGHSLIAELCDARAQLRTSEAARENQFDLIQGLRAQLKKAEGALAASGLVITILEATGDNIKKLPGRGRNSNPSG